jgi:NAD(P)-dependent dehydrogenase (short-subunit alcohol dehydrogenase family)
MNVNVKAPVRLTREVIKVMQKQGYGNIVNVASKAGTCGATHGLAYGASKAALISVTQNTAWLYKEEGIRCNAVAPGCKLSLQLA